MTETHTIQLRACIPLIRFAPISVAEAWSGPDRKRPFVQPKLMATEVSFGMSAGLIVTPTAAAIGRAGRRPPFTRPRPSQAVPNPGIEPLAADRGNSCCTAAPNKARAEGYRLDQFGFAAAGT